MGVRGFDIAHDCDSDDFAAYDAGLLHKTSNVFRTAQAYPGSVKHAGATEAPPCDVYWPIKKEGSWFMVAFNVTCGPGVVEVARTVNYNGDAASLVVLETEAYIKCEVLSTSGGPAPYMRSWFRFVEGERESVTPSDVLALGLAGPDTPVIDAVEEYDFFRIGHGIEGPAPLIRGKHIAGQDIPMTAAMSAASVTFVDMGGIHRVRLYAT